jgi:hypothetical protein
MRFSGNITESDFSVDIAYPKCYKRLYKIEKDSDMRICVEYSEVCDHHSHSGEQFGDWSESYTSSVTGAYRISEVEKVPYHADTFRVPDDATEVFVVYMIYSTGDSFGRADGKIDIIHCTSNEEAADQLAKLITDTPDEFTIKFTDDFGRDISLHNNGAGYFESINYVGVERFTIGTGKSNRRYYVN